MDKVNAQVGDIITIRIAGIDPSGVPDSVEVKYVRAGKTIYPGLAAGWWASLRHDLFDALWKWWWWVDVARKDDNG